MHTTTLTLALAALLPSAPAQVIPHFAVEFLGTATSVTGINGAAEVIGTEALGGAAERAWVAAPGRTKLVLPLPSGRVSSRPIDINEAGWIAGVVSSVAYADPGLGGVGALWVPDGSGGYTVREFGRLPGDFGSAVTALNDVGDLLGYSQGGLFRRAVRFTAAGAAVDLTPTGAFDITGVNDQRIAVCFGQRCARLDLNTLTLQDLGLPAGSFTSTKGAAINAAGQVAGVAIVATSTSCDRVTARFTDGIGWELFGSCGVHHGATSLNAHGDLTSLTLTSASLHIEGLGAFQLQPQISNAGGTWSLGLLASGLVNDARQVAVIAQNTLTGQFGAVLLTPLTFVGAAVCAGDGLAAPCPCANTTPAGRHEACARSNGRGARLSATGSASIAAGDLVLALTQAAPQSVGLLVQGMETPPAPVYDGLLCVSGPARRLSILSTNGAGSASSAGSIAAMGAVQAGDTRVYQVWYRDVGGPCGRQANTSTALRITWQ